MSNVSKGNYYKKKTKDWFINKGYACEYIERYINFFAKGKQMFLKKDLFASDGISFNANEIIFWNSKLGKSGLSKAKKEFEKYPFPFFVKRQVIVWEKRARQPLIYEA